LERIGSTIGGGGPRDGNHQTKTQKHCPFPFTVCSQRKSKRPGGEKLWAKKKETEKRSRTQEENKRTFLFGVGKITRAQKRGGGGKKIRPERGKKGT